MVSKSDQRRSARISGSKDKITQEEITKNDTTETATSSNTTNSEPAKLKIVSSEDDSELEKRHSIKQTNEDAEFARWMAIGGSDDSENIPSESIVQKVTESLKIQETHFKRIKV